MDNTLSKIVGQRINAMLAERNKKQKELAAKLNVTDNTVSYYCSGTRLPNTSQIKKIAEFLDCSADYLLGLSPNKTTDEKLKGVCDYTGLSEKAIEKISAPINRIIPDKINLLSAVIESWKFFSVLDCIKSYHLHLEKENEEAKRQFDYIHALYSEYENGKISIDEFIDKYEDEFETVEPIQRISNGDLFEIQELVKEVVQECCCLSVNRSKELKEKTDHLRSEIAYIILRSEIADNL